MSSSDTRDIEYEKHLEKLAYSWNSKKSGNNIDLSSLNTFTRLYLLLKDGEQNLKNSLTAAGAEILTLDSDDSALNEKELIDISTYITQINVNDKYNSGGVGINSLKVERSNREAFTIRYDMSLTITNSKIIDERLDLSKIIQLSSDWIIAYGWDGFRDINRSRGPNSAPEIITPSVPSINQTASGPTISYNNSDKNNGYWDWNYVKLYKFNFNVTNEGHLQGSLQFSNADALNISSTRIHEISMQVLNDLKKPNSSQLITDISTIGHIPGYEELLITYPQKDVNYGVISDFATENNEVESVYGFDGNKFQSFNFMVETEDYFNGWNNSYTIDPNYNPDDNDNKEKTYVFGSKRTNILNPDGTSFDITSLTTNAPIKNIYDFTLFTPLLNNSANFFISEYSDIKTVRSLADFDSWLVGEVTLANNVLSNSSSTTYEKNMKILLNNFLIQIPSLQVDGEEVDSSITKGWSKPFKYTGFRNASVGVPGIIGRIEINTEISAPDRQYLERLFSDNDQGVRLPTLIKYIIRKNNIKNTTPSNIRKFSFNSREFSTHENPKILSRPRPPLVLRNGEPIPFNDEIRSGYYLYDLKVDLSNTKLAPSDDLTFFYNKKTTSNSFNFGGNLLSGNYDNILGDYYKYAYGDSKPYNNTSSYKPFFNELTITENDVEETIKLLENGSDHITDDYNNRNVKLEYLRPSFISNRQYSLFLQSYKQKIKFGVDFLQRRFDEE
jgi:hypothetical protein